MNNLSENFQVSKNFENEAEIPNAKTYCLFHDDRKPFKIRSIYDASLITTCNQFYPTCNSLYGSVPILSVTGFNTQTFYIVSSECIYAFCTDNRRNSHYSSTQH